MENFEVVIDRSNEFSAKYDEMDMKFGKKDVYSMWVADMDFEVAPVISEAIEKRAKQKIYGYTTRPDSYYEAMCNWYKRRYDFNIEKEWLIHSPGVVTSLGVLIKELTEPGDQVIIQSPVYYPFFDSVVLNGRTLVDCPLIPNGLDYRMDFDLIEEKAKNASFLILCNPHNPVGRVWTQEELETLAAICLKHQVRIISDEIHGDLVFDNNRYMPMATLSEEVADITVTCLSATKSFNLAGLQASFIVAPREADYKKIESVFTILDLKRNNCFSLVAVEAAYSQGEPWLESMVAYVKGNMDFVVKYCSEHIPMLKPNTPEGTYLQWIDCSVLKLEDDALRTFMIEEAGIALNIGTGFGETGSGFVRLNLACPRNIVEGAMKSLKRAVNKHIGMEA